ncbi:putative MFS family arabinose efflux permease [Conyzicola lurida]|uniref:Putative MFS family arabinose efflux permease n=1 Tax=Conyzicola lurida TaxID=1172621 RepID=A0A841AQA4_9MICO|nr:putative MFS family arabinose efflux permease [Conyzicola lurida]
MGTDSWTWRTRLFSLAVVSAVSVSVLYLPQSLLTGIASSLGVEPVAAGIVATMVQVGYAVGIFFLVPLGDRVQPRRQITVQASLLAAALLLSAILPTVVCIAVGFFVVGLVANIAQLIIPTAAKLSPAGQGGATTSTLVGALLVGVFGGRILASLLIDAIGWRWVVAVFALLVLAAVPLVRRSLTADLHLSGAGRSHASLLASTLRLARTSPVLVQSAVMQFFVFGTFNLFWSSMVLHLTGGNYGWSVLGAGLFSLVGLAAGFATTQGGRFIDRFGPLRFAGVLFVVLLAATASAIVDSDSIWLFGATIFVVTLANQLIQSANQSRALAANPGATAGANTLFMVGMFLGGAAGATVGPLAFTAGGVPLVATVGVGFVTVAALVWALAWFTAPGRVTSTGSLPLPQNP